MKKLFLIALGLAAPSLFANECSFQDEFSIPSKMSFGEKSLTAAIAQPLNDGDLLVTSVGPWKGRQYLVLDTDAGLIALEGKSGAKSEAHQEFMESVYPTYATFSQYPGGYKNENDICVLHSTLIKMHNRERLLIGEEFDVSNELLRHAVSEGGKLGFVVHL